QSARQCNRRRQEDDVMTSNPLPPQVQQYVGRFVARRRRLSLFKTVAIAIAFTLVWMLAWCVVDRLLALPANMRMALLGVNLLAVVVLLFRPVRDAIRGEVRWIDAADQIEQHN